MTLRLSTQSLYMQGLNSLLSRQSEIARTQQQLSSGVKLTQGKDDPVGMATAQRLDHLKAALTQYDSDALRVDHRLRMQENALVDANDSLTRARELAIQANSGALGPDDRKAIATEVLQLRKNLLDIANRDDGNGRRLFAGTRDGVIPFTDNAGSVIYHGDDGRNAVEVAPDVAIEDGDPGSAVFLRVRTGDGIVRGSAAAGNTGTGVLQSSGVVDHAAWTGQSLRVEFTAADAWRVLDGDGNELATGSYTEGATITAGGMQLKISGAPAAGDSFRVEPAPVRDVFATLQGLADALEAPAADPAARAWRANQVGAALGDLATAQDHMLSLRAATGSRLSALDNAADARSATELTLHESLSELRDVDVADAASRLALHLAAIEAAQKTMLRVQGLSLFDRM